MTRGDDHDQHLLGEELIANQLDRQPETADAAARSADELDRNHQRGHGRNGPHEVLEVLQAGLAP